MSTTSQVLGIHKHALARTERVAAKINEAMAAVEADIEREGGLYPFNGGRLSRQELCRRAGLRSSVLDGPSHKKTTLRKVQVWLAAIEGRMTRGKRSVRKVVTERIDDWKGRAERYALQTHLYHLELVTLQHRLQDANQRIGELEDQLTALQAVVSAGKVVQFPRK